MGNAQSSGRLGAGPSPQQAQWATDIGVTAAGAADFAALVRTVNGSRVQEQAVQRSGGLISQGEFGAVHRGTYNGRPVAVKVIGLTGTAYSSGRNSVDEFFRQMHLEISTMSHVGSHPNCISMFGCAGRFPDSGEGKDALCIQLILELMPNGTLFDALHQKRQVAEWGEKIKVLRGIAAGVQHLHSRSIVHRDLSSLNILFSADMQPKIADFGCARKCVGGVYDPRKVLGSPAYMSPEQLVGSKLTTKSDCWSLGVLIWEVLSERGPWNDRDSNNRQLLKLHIVDNGAKLPAISAQRFEVLYAKHYEAQVAELLAGCFRVTPAKRSTASDIARSLAALDGPLRKTHYKNGVATSSPMPSSQQAMPARSARPTSSPAPMRASAPVDDGSEAKAQLEAKIRAFYQHHNPAKLGDVHLVAKYHMGKEDLLNDRLRAQYNTDLTEFCSTRPELWGHRNGLRTPSEAGCACSVM